MNRKSIAVNVFNANLLLKNETRESSAAAARVETRMDESGVRSGDSQPLPTRAL